MTAKKKITYFVEWNAETGEFFFEFPQLKSYYAVILSQESFKKSGVLETNAINFEVFNTRPNDDEVNDDD